jgi:hypothetical protein
MSRYTERAGDIAEYYIGGLIFSVVAAMTAAVMAVGFGAIEGINWLRHKD